MKAILPVSLALFALIASASAAEQKAVVPNPVTATFYIVNVQCGSCVDAITESVKKVPSVTKVEGLTGDSGFAQISFDNHASSYHQVAQAISDATPVHGDKYAATLRLKVPDYAKGDNAAKVDEIFAKHKADVKVVTKDKAKGEFEIQFLPLKVDKEKKVPQGWNAGKFGHPIHDDAPKGLGLSFQIVKEGAKK